jgi:aminoglycoside/choline kinase family phosphotransferase
MILAWYPEDQRPSLDRFRITTRLLADAGIPVPEILDLGVEDGWMLVQDVGESTLFDLRERGWTFLAPRVREAARLSSRVAAVELPEAGPLLGPLDAAALAAELEMTWEEFLVPSGLDREVGLGRALDRALTEIVRRLGEAPRVPCHRDFMARNLVPANAETALFVLDHQDLRPGPAGYDLASLLNDSLFPDRALVTEILQTATAASRAGYEPCVVQRTLKIVGTFRRFARAGSPRYLELIPPSLTRCVEALAQLEWVAGPELARDLRRHWRLDRPSAGASSGL